MKQQTAEQKKIVKEFKEFLTDNKSYCREIIDFCKKRKSFIMKKDGMWSSTEIDSLGKNNPHLSINRNIGYINQAANEVLEQEIGCNIAPRSSGANEKMARVREAQIMALRDLCGAVDSEGYAYREVLAAGMGIFRENVEYVNGTSHDKTLRWAAVRDFASVVWSNEAEGPGLCSKEKCSLESTLTKSAFEAKYGRYDNIQKDAAVWEQGSKKKIYEYWRVVNDKVTSYETQDGKGISADEYDGMEEEEKAGIPLSLDEEGEPFQRDVDDPTVEQYIIGDEKVLSGPVVFPASRIPIQIVLGNEVEIDGKLEVQSLGLFAEEPAKILNFLKSVKAQLWSKSPIPVAFVPIETMSPVQEQALAQAATSGGGESGVAVIRYTSVDSEGHTLPAPRLEQPILTDASLAMEEKMAREDIEATMGMNNSPFLMNPKDASGVSLREQKATANTGAYHFLKKWQGAVEEGMRIAMEVCERMPIKMQIKLGGDDEKEEVIWLNSMESASPTMSQMDIDDEEYDLSINVGPSSQTMLEKSQRELQELYKADPAAVPLTADLYVLAGNNPKKEAIAKRFRAALPPGIQAAINGADPQVMALTQKLQQTQQIGQQQMGALQQKLNQATQELQAEKNSNQANLIKANAAAQKAASESDHKSRLLELKTEELRLKELQIQAVQFDSITKRMLAEKPPAPPPEQKTPALEEALT